MNIRLLHNDESNVLVDLPSGKVTKNGLYKRIRAQQGMTCALFAMRRISIFNTNDKNHLSVLAYKKIKKALSTEGQNYILLIKLIHEIFDDHKIDIVKEIGVNKSFINTCSNFNHTNRLSLSAMKFFKILNSSQKWLILYNVFLDKILIPLLNLKKSTWHPKDGCNGLKECLKNSGAIFVSGKFGAWCYEEKPVLIPSETTQNRRVFGFKKDSYNGDAKPFIHGIIIDQIKIINGKEMVFFRDPYCRSSSHMPEKVFLISYDTFVSRLTDLQLNRFAKNECTNDMTFGYVSSCPEKLYTAKKQS